MVKQLTVGELIEKLQKCDATKLVLLDGFDDCGEAFGVVEEENVQILREDMVVWHEQMNKELK